MKIRFISLYLLLAIFVSCQHKEKWGCEELLPPPDLSVSSIDSAINANSDSYISKDSETSDNKKLIEEKYGTQWDFCDCVRKNDSINKVIDKTPEHANFDPIFARMDEIDRHCKEMLTFPNKTPEERAKYELRVKKCLRGN